MKLVLNIKDPDIELPTDGDDVWIWWCEDLDRHPPEQDEWHSDCGFVSYEGQVKWWCSVNDITLED